MDLDINDFENEFVPRIVELYDFVIESFLLFLKHLVD